MGVFVDCLMDDIRRNIQQYWSTCRSIQMYDLIAYNVSIDATHVTGKRNLGTHGQKNNGLLSSARAAGRRSSTAGLPKALLVSYSKAPYPSRTFQAYCSSASLSDPSTYCRFCLENQSSPHSHATDECPHVARGDPARLDGISEANYPAYHNLLTESYRARRRTPGGRQSRESARMDDAHVNLLVPKK